MRVAASSPAVLMFSPAILIAVRCITTREQMGNRLSRHIASLTQVA